MLHSLRAKLVLTYAGLTLLAVGGLALYTVGSLEDLLLRRLADDLSAQARLIADQVAEDLTEHPESVRDRLARADASIDASIMVVDSRRRILGVSEVQGSGQVGTEREDDALQEALLGSTRSTVLPRTSSGGEVLYVTTPVRRDGQIVGAVRLAYQLENVERTLHALNLTVGVGALVTVLLAALVSYAFARAIGDPIRDLSSAARAVAAGHLEQHLRPASGDEVGDLTRSFAAMTEQLRQADVARREFASDVSHELHSLAGAMQTAAEALERGASQDEALHKRLLSGLVGHTRRLNRLSADLLERARLEEGRLKFALQPCSLADVVRRTIQEFAAEACQRGLQLGLEAGKDLTLEVDEMRLQQAVGNLVENALKYTPSGGSVRVSTSATDGEYLITVADNGQGIPPDELPHIWDRYYRVEGRASGGPAGTGLGLAITAGIVRAHRGYISIESTPGHGTTFTVHLPRPGQASRRRDDFG
jgi:two-component system OmpR family sensor kinase